MKFTVPFAGCAVVWLAIGPLESAARADCTDTAAATSKADDVLTLNNRCGTAIRAENVGITAADLDMQLQDDWANDGVNGPCNEASELQKTLNSWTLLNQGVEFTAIPTFNPAGVFHASECAGGDYCNLAGASSNGDWHPWMRYQVIFFLGGSYADYDDQDGVFDVGTPDLIQMACPVFDFPHPFGTLTVGDPTSRAEVMAHEAWHAWEDEHDHPWNTDCGHERCPDANPGNKNNPFCLAGSECDTWYPHGSSLAGAMNGEMHRPYQVMVEFACDLVNSPQDWVPLIVREEAKADAAYFSANDIMNPAPMPLCNGGQAVGMVDGVCSNGSLQCDQQTHCKGGNVCDPTTGCCVPAPVCSVAGSPSCDGTCACDFTTGCCVAQPPPPPPPP